MLRDNWEIIADHIKQATSSSVDIKRVENVTAGSDMSHSFLLYGGDEVYFVKTRQASELILFDTEAQGLAELRATKTLRVPDTIVCGSTDKEAYLVLEYCRFTAQRRDTQLGKQLAKLHRHQAKQYGWHKDNFIGVTPQINTQTDDWIAFWRDCRLAPQLELAYANGYQKELEKNAKKLLDSLKYFFADYTPLPSLLHGDLWSGNTGFMNGEPVIFDPAVYYGDRETDIAMTELFGGFRPEFYDAYNEEWPLDANYEKRKALYNFYHQLNHLNLFGVSYLRSCMTTLKNLCNQLGKQILWY